MQFAISVSIPQRSAQQRWAGSIPIVLFEGGDLRTIDPRSSRSSSATPGTRGWATPPKGILTRPIDCQLAYWMLITMCANSYGIFGLRRLYSYQPCTCIGGWWGGGLLRCRWPFPNATPPPFLLFELPDIATSTLTDISGRWRGSNL